MRVVLMILCRYSRTIIAVAFMLVGGYLLFNAFCVNKTVSDMKSWLERNGDAELKGYYAELSNSKKQQALGVVCKTYENRYGKWAWKKNFHSDNPNLQNITYMDLAEIAIGISTAEKRDAFLETHGSTYDACIQQGFFNEANHYVEVLKKLRDIGGLTWQVASENAFSICVYDAIQANSGLSEQEKTKLWSWYVDNYKWCNSFLFTCNPNDEAKLDEVLAFILEHSNLLRRFDNEISTLSKDEIRELADGDDEDETHEALYASCLTFIGGYSTVLEAILKADGSISMLEVMAVIANNGDAFDLSTPSSCRKAAVELVQLYKQKRILWDFAADDFGAGVIRFYHTIPQWCEQLVGEYGQMNVVGFLFKYYNSSAELLRVASEILYRCGDPGWAVLQKYRDNDEFKSMMSNPKIGFRIVPYYLKQGDKVFSELRDDPRWIDEMLDKDGNLKRQDVSWYEVSDIATIVKKMAQDRPITSEEWGWAAFEVVDLAAMALTGGAAKAATTAGKQSMKRGAKAIGRKAAKQLTGNGLRRLECKMIVRQGAKKIVKGGAKRNLSLLKRTTKMFKNVTKTLKNGSDAMKNAMRKVKKMPQAEKIKIYRSAKALLFAKFFAHTVPDKGPDFIAGVEEETGVVIGKTINAFVSGAGEAFKAAVKESFGASKPESLFSKMTWVALGCVFLVMGLKLVMPKKQ